MIAVLLSFELAEVAYVGEVDPTQHVVLEQKSEGVFTVIKNGIALRELIQTMLATKSQVIEEEFDNQQLPSPLFVCFSPKGKKIAQPIFHALSQ
jgi:hypothetical protein